MPTTKTEKVTENDDDLVWAENPANGRKKEMRRDRRAILALAGWKPCEPPGPDAQHQVVTSFPSMPVDHGAAEADASTSQNGGSHGGAGTEKKES